MKKIVDTEEVLARYIRQTTTLSDEASRTQARLFLEDVPEEISDIEQLASLLVAIGMMDYEPVAKDLSDLYGRLKGETPEESAKRFATQRRGKASIEAHLGRPATDVLKDALVDCWAYATLIPGFGACREIVTLVMNLLGDEIGPIYARREQERREQQKDAPTE